MKTFCISIYNENYSFFEKNNLTPVGLGNDDFDKSWMNDKFQNDISHKNKNFGEYTFHYKLWKDSALKNENYEWIGFCTYRRFWINKNAPNPKNIKELNATILKRVPQEWSEYDCILAEPIVLGKEKFYANSDYVYQNNPKKGQLKLYKSLKDITPILRTNQKWDNAIKKQDFFIK